MSREQKVSSILEDPLMIKPECLLGGKCHEWKLSHIASKIFIQYYIGNSQHPFESRLSIV
jgi:hypothetical protein